MESLRMYPPTTIERVRSNLELLVDRSLIYLGQMGISLSQDRYRTPALQRVANMSDKYTIAYNVGIAIGIDICSQKTSEISCENNAYSKFLDDIRSGVFRVFNIHKEQEINDLINGIEQTCSDFAIAWFVKDLEEALVIKSI